MDVKKLVDEHWEEYLSFLKTMMEIESVNSKPLPNAPYGKGPKEALEKILMFGKEFGFKGQMVEDVVSYLQWGDEEDYIGILGHLDVVPAGDNWHYPPFSLTQDKGYLYGRGILDNKGPITSCLFAMYLLKKSGFKPKKTLRIIFGSDEEMGMKEIPVYLKHHKAPTFGFTPDCKYPVVYGERGVVGCRLKKSISKTDCQLLGIFTGDTGKDHVSDYLSVMVGQKKIEAFGKRTPSNAPELGKSALTLLLGQLQEVKELSRETRAYFHWLYTHFHEKHFGEGLALNLQDEASGRLILTPVYLQKEGAELVFEISIRYPVSYQEDEILNILQQQLSKDVTLEVTRRMPGIKKDPNDPNIVMLGKIYEKITGLDGTPVTTTGGTYARKMPNIVAFGPSFPGQKGIAHKADEWMKVEDLKENVMIYLTSIKELTKGTMEEDKRCGE